MGKRPIELVTQKKLNSEGKITRKLSQKQNKTTSREKTRFRDRNNMKRTRKRNGAVVLSATDLEMQIGIKL